MQSNKIEAIYVELDCLLDTRLGTIARMSDDLARQTLDKQYHSRDTDIFVDVDMEEYKELYAKRDVETLAHSACTNALPLLKHLVGVITDQATVRPYYDGVKVVVNTYPYQLSDEEIGEIGKAIAAWMEGLAPVELTYISPENLTPAHCKLTYAMMVVYEYEHWMNLHAEAFKTTRLPQVTMFVPALYFGTKPTDDELKDIMKEAAHPMRAIEQLASPIIELKLIDVKYFSIISKE